MTHDELIKKWSCLFTDEEGYKTLTYLEIPERWYDLVDKLCEQIMQYLLHSPNASPFHFLQIKEKFGGLRVYMIGSDPFIDGMARMAEAYSFKV